jgi:hypothetical protein
MQHFDVGPASVSRRGDEQSPWRRRRRTIMGMALGAVTVVNTACYSYAPLLGGTPRPGEPVGLVVNDVGRVALGEQVGTGVDRIEGILVDARDEQYVVRVSKVRNIRGQSAHWSGEPLRVPLSAVARVEGRYFSGRKTTLAVGIAIAAISLAIVGSSLAGFGFSQDRPPEGPPGGGSDQ